MREMPRFGDCYLLGGWRKASAVDLFAVFVEEMPGVGMFARRFFSNQPLFENRH